MLIVPLLIVSCFFARIRRIIIVNSIATSFKNKFKFNSLHPHLITPISSPVRRPDHNTRKSCFQNFLFSHNDINWFFDLLNHSTFYAKKKRKTKQQQTRWLCCILPISSHQMIPHSVIRFLTGPHRRQRFFLSLFPCDKIINLLIWWSVM